MVTLAFDGHAAPGEDAAHGPGELRIGELHAVIMDVEPLGRRESLVVALRGGRHRPLGRVHTRYRCGGRRFIGRGVLFLRGIRRRRRRRRCARASDESRREETRRPFQNPHAFSVANSAFARFLVE